MNYLDLIIAIPLAWGAFNGFRKGLVIEVASLVALIAGIYGAMEFSFLTASWLHENFDWSENVVQMLSFIITFLGIVFVVHLIGRGIQKIVKMVALGTINRIFGALFGATKFLLIIAVLLYIVNAADKRYPFIDKEDKESSMFYKPVSGLIPLIYPKIDEQLKEKDYSFIA